MSGGARRAALAAIGGDLLAARGGPGERRGAALARRLAGTALRPIALDALAAAPAWARLPRAAQDGIADRMALIATAPSLARVIDGAVLRGLAEAAGEAAVDWAQQTGGREAAGGLPVLPGERLRPLGYALLRRTMPAGLVPLLDDIAQEEAPGCTDALAWACLGAVMQAEAA